MLKRVLRSAGWWAADGVLDRVLTDDRVTRIVAKIAPKEVAVQQPFEGAPKTSPFFHYNTTFDGEEIIRRHAVPNLSPSSQFLTNFLGVLIDPVVMPAVLEGRQGQVEPAPIPANWHADIAEFAAALRAIDLAKNSFTMAELGCGWGCWMNNTGVAARRAGLDVRLTGVEGDAGHLEFARMTCETNGLRSDQVRLIHGVAAASAGVALFPKQQQSGIEWGLEPIFNATAEERARAIEVGACDELRMVPLAEIVGEQSHLDLLHIDIQGGEADFVHNSIEVLNGRVAYLLIGTHSREIEGQLFQDLLHAGWVLEIERPAILLLHGVRPVVTVDGVQGWRNPRLRPLL